MRKNLLKHVIAFVALFLGNSVHAQCNGGTIRIVANDSTCGNGFATMKLSGHTTTAGTTYTWERSNSTDVSGNPINFATMTVTNASGFVNSGRDTQNFNPGLGGRWYRCKVTCAAGFTYSDIYFIAYQQRDIKLKRIQCDLTGAGNDSIVLKVDVINQPVQDSNSVKSIRWERAVAGGSGYNFVKNTWSDSIKVQFTKNAFDYRAAFSICPLPDWPGGIQVTNAVRVGLNPSNLDISTKDCPNNEATLSILDGAIRNILKDSFKYNWYSASTAAGLNGAGAIGGATSPTLKINPSFRQNMYYRATTKLCAADTAASSKDTTNAFQLWVNLGTFDASYDCSRDQVLLEYQYRDSLRKSSVTTLWFKSSNDSLNPTPYTIPVASSKHYLDLINKTNTYYKIYTRLCANSPVILDSSNYVRLYLNVDSGQLKLDTATCPNDTITLQLLNYNAVASFPTSSVWEYQQNGTTFYQDFTGPQTNTEIKFRMLQGLTSYRKSFYFCPTNKYAKKISSSSVSTFMPYILVFDSFNCDTNGNLTMRVLNDTIKYVDYTGTKIRGGAKSYTWYSSPNKINWTLVSGASSANLSIPNANKNLFYKRIRNLCPNSTPSYAYDTSNWSNYSFAKPNSSNGRAVVTSEICLNKYASIGVINNTPLTGQTPYYVWQGSPDELVWSDLYTNSSNLDTTGTLVTSQFQYYRRLTFWCPSGVIDSTESIPIRYNKPIGCETFVSIPALGPNKLYNCWTYRNACPTWNPKYGANPIFSRAGVGRSDNAMSHQTVPPAPKTADGKLITPAYDLKRGKYYRFSFWHQEDASNLCWDSLYVTWGRNLDECEIVNKFGDTLTRFSFDQQAKFWADFTPPDDGIYYFAINYRDADATRGNIVFDDVCIKEVQSCEGASPVKGATFAPAKIIDRFEGPFKANSYDKTRVTHQYCIWDTIMLTYNESNYANNFDYYGMTYQFYKMRLDEDWKVNDNFFRPVAPDNNCHITNKSNYHVMNVLVTDTNTYYKIVATCQLDGKEYHSDSLLVNGTHSVPYCESWEGVGNINNQPSAMPQKNSGEIKGKVPSFQFCATCWAAYPQNVIAAPGPPTQPTPDTVSLYSVTLPFRNVAGGTLLPPQLDPDGGWQGGNNVVIISDNTPLTGVNLTLRKSLVYPAVRLYKGRAYRITFRWADNRKDLGPPLYGPDAAKLDSIYLMWAKGNEMGKSGSNFTTANRIGPAEMALKSNLKETGSAKYRTFWRDFTPNDTGTYFFAIGAVVGTSNGGTYRFQMDYFCIDTIPIDTSCNSKPTFTDPLVIRISPDAKEWYPGDTSVTPGTQWCVGTTMNIELSTAQAGVNSWSYGWKMEWQRNIIDPNGGGSPNWITVSTTNSFSWVLRYKYENYRLRISNWCGTKDTIIGPFNIFPGGLGGAKCGGPAVWTEEFDPPTSLFPACWDGYTTTNCPWARGVTTDYTQQHYNAKSPDFYLKLNREGNIPTCGGAAPAVMTFVPPGRAVLPGVTYRFSFWYRDNGLSQTWDSLRVGWSLVRSTAAWPTNGTQGNTLINRVNGDIVKNFRNWQWRYYTAEFTPSMDTVYHFKIATHQTPAKSLSQLNFDNFKFKPKYNFDALVISADSPEYNCALSATSTVRVRVMNIGVNTLDSIPLEFSVTDKSTGNLVGTGKGTVPGPVTSNQVKMFYLQNVNLSTVGENILNVWTNIPGEDYRCDDTFTTIIQHNKQYDAPTDTIDSVCIYSNLRRTESIPPGGPKIRWYKNIYDVEPFSVSDTFGIDSFKKDTCVYRTIWNGDFCFSDPKSSSVGIPTFTSATGGLTFDNYSRDSLIIDSVMVYANTTGTGTVTISQFNAPYNIPMYSVPFNITKLGKQFLPIKRKIPPGTDYKIVYTGSAQMAVLQTGAPYYYIFAYNGCPGLEFNINGDHNYPANAAAYFYFFNMKIVKPGCETEKVKICFKPVDAPNFTLKDTARVCSSPVYQICGPDAPVGDNYTYQWSTSGNTTKCEPAIASKDYRLTVTNAFGCTVADNLDLIVDPSPQYSLGNDTSFCRFSPYTIKTGLSDSDNVVTWNNSMAGTSISVLNPGTYISTAFNTVNFCSAKDTIVLTRIELPSFSLGNDRVFCGETGDLSSSLPTSGLTFQWGSNGGPTITKSQVDASGKGRFTVVGTDNVTKCKNVDTINATLISNPNLNLSPRIRELCREKDNLYLTPVTPPPGPYYYTWSSPSTSTARSIQVTIPGKYKLTIQDSVYGCSSVDSVAVTFKEIPIFDLGSDVVKCSDAETLSGPVMSGVTFSWKGPRGPMGSGNFVIVDTSGNYYLKVDNGCYTFEDTINYLLKKPASSAMDLLKDADTGCQQVTLTVTSQPSKATVKWGYPIPSSISNSNTQLITKTGLYSVSLSNECGSSTKSVYVKIDSTPKADFVPLYLPNCMAIGLSNRSEKATRYDWDFGEGGTSTQENPLYNYKLEGDYIVTLKASNSCGFSSKSVPLKKRVKNCDTFALSITTNLAEANLYLFPNPTKSKTTLYGVGMPNGKYQISVRNVLGQIVEEMETKVVGNKVELSIDASRFANGEYIIQVANEKESIVRRLIVTK